MLKVIYLNKRICVTQKRSLGLRTVLRNSENFLF